MALFDTKNSKQTGWECDDLYLDRVQKAKKDEEHRKRRCRKKQTLNNSKHENGYCAVDFTHTLCNVHDENILRLQTVSNYMPLILFDLTELMKVHITCK